MTRLQAVAAFDSMLSISRASARAELLDLAEVVESAADDDDVSPRLITRIAGGLRREAAEYAEVAS